MAAILPFLQSLPQQLQIPVMQPNFSESQVIAQRANNIFETGLNHVKNAYSSVINAPVTDTRNIEKKQEYIQNFRDGLKKITKEDIRMPQNVIQAENLLSPFWQDDIMLRDMGYTQQLQSQMGRYEQAANSSDAAIRASANPESLEDLNNFAEKLRNANGDINVYNKLGTPKYLPLDRVSDYMTDLMIKDKDDNNITFTSKYQLDQDGNYVRDANGQLIPLPHGELIKQTNGILALPAKTHLAGTRIGNRFDAQYELRAKNQYNRAVKMVKQQYQGTSDDEAEKIVDKQFYTTVREPVSRQLQTYNGAIDAYKSRIESLEKQAASPTGLTRKQADDLDITREMLKNAQQAQVELTNTLTDMDSNSGKVTSNFIMNRLAHSYKYEDIHQWGETMTFKNVKSELIKDEPYFATLEANERRFGHALTQQRDRWHHEEAMMRNDIDLAKAVAEYPELADYYRSRGINVPNIGTGTSSGLPQGASISGLATNMQQNYTVSKIYQDVRANNLNKIGDGLYGVPSQNNPAGGLIFALQDKFTTNEFDALRKYQEMHLKGGLTYVEGGTKFTPQSVQEGRDYEAAINKLCTLSGKDRKSTRSVDDINNMIVDVIGTNLSQNMNDGVNHDKIAQYTSVYSKVKNIHDQVRREDEEHDKLVLAAAKKDPNAYGNVLVYNRDGSPRMISEADIPYSRGIEGIGSDGKHYKFSAQELRKKYIDGAIDLGTSIQRGGSMLIGPMLGTTLKIDGIEITPTNHDDYTDFIHVTSNAQMNIGESEKVGRQRKELYEKTVPNSQYYKTLTGETDKFVAVPITGESKFGKQAKSNDLNLNYLREAMMPGNHLVIEDDKGRTINDDETLATLSQLFNNKADAAKYIGDTYGYLPSDKLGRQKLAVKVNTRPATSTEEKSPYIGVEGKTYYITLSPAAKGQWLSSLEPAPDRFSYDPLLSDNPDKNAEYPSQYQRNLGVDSKLTYNKASNSYNIVGTYYTTDKTSGQRVKNTMNRAIPGSYAPYEVRAAFQEMNQRAVDATIASNKLHISTNGSKVQPQNGNR